MIAHRPQLFKSIDGAYSLNRRTLLHEIPLSKGGGFCLPKEFVLVNTKLVRFREYSHGYIIPDSLLGVINIFAAQIHFLILGVFDFCFGEDYVVDGAAVSKAQRVLAVIPTNL